jgi:hypothetical protein
VAGSVIISLTLTARDHFHEQAKDFETFVENARNIAHAEALNEVTLQRLDLLEEEVSNSSSLKPKQSRLGSHERNSVLDGNIYLAILKLDHARELVRLLPQDRNREEDFEHLTKKLREVEEQIAAIDPDYNKKYLTDPELKEKGSQVTNAVQSLLRDVQLLLDDVYVDLDHIQERYDRLSAVFSLLSYVIIAVGLGLWITGQMATPGEAPELKPEVTVS